MMLIHIFSVWLWISGSRQWDFFDAQSCNERLIREESNSEFHGQVRWFAGRRNEELDIRLSIM